MYPMHRRSDSRPSMPVDQRRRFAAEAKEFNVTDLWYMSRGDIEKIASMQRVAMISEILPEEYSYAQIMGCDNQLTCDLAKVLVPYKLYEFKDEASLLEAYPSGTFKLEAPQPA